MSPKPGHRTTALQPKAAGGQGFLVAGVGASAGGLESFTRLLRALPAHPGVAFVLVQHLDPTHESVLAEILERESAMPVTEAVDGMRVEPDHVYAMPPNVTIEFVDGAIRLSPRKASAAESQPIDRFLRSLAKESGSLAAGVVLSGTGSDGAQGLVAIKESGGLTYAQDPLSAAYDGMPRAAMAAGAVDAVLDPEHIAEHLARVGRRLGEGTLNPPAIAPDAVDQDSLDDIIGIVRTASGLDLTHYRRTTLLRRIARRMLLGGVDTMREYASVLRGDRAEIEAFYRDVLVNVTSFFRDPAAIDTLTRQAFPAILARKGRDTTIRLWVPGCSRGQEAYSILMALVEFLESSEIRPDVQMFASDVNEADIRFARAGVYPESLVGEMSAERLARFFTQVPGGYRVDQIIRDMCVFAVHDVTRDPPFSKLDLVSFRNVLIYMEPPLQKHVLGVLHYALEPGGFLLLGSAETAGRESRMFTVADKKHRLYVRKPGPARLPSPLGAPTSVTPQETPAAVSGERSGFDVLQEAERLVLGAYTPSALLVNEALDVLQFRGRVAEFLDPAPGAPELTLPKMVGPGLASTARAAIREAAKVGHSVGRSGSVATRGGGRREVSVEAVPITSPSGDRYYLILLQTPAQPGKTTAPPKGTAARSDSADAVKLQHELDEARIYVETVITEKDAANRDLEIAGDKLQVTNEELRTINEEFQTTQEELQSTNEELTTLNDELRNRNVELAQLADDLDNVIQSVEIPMLILGADMAIHRFTPQVERIANIVPTDIGRSLTDFTLRIQVDDLKGAVQRVVKDLAPSETEVRTADGQWYSMRISPYRTGRGAVDGVVIAFLDIDLLKHALQSADDSREHAQALVETVREPLLTLGADLTVLEANQAFYDTFAVEAAETVGSHVYKLGDGQWDIPELRSLLSRILPGDTEFAGLEVERDFPRIGPRIMMLNARRVRETHGAPTILLAVEDVTRPRRQARLDAALSEVSQKINSTLDLDSVLDDVLEVSAPAVAADSAAILLKRPDGWLIQSALGMPDSIQGQALDDSAVPLSILSAETQDPVLVPDISTDDRFKGSYGVGLGHHCVLMVPLLLRTKTIGSISFHGLTPGACFTDADVDFATHLGTLLSLAFENASLYSAQRKIADTLQTALLTPPRKIPGVECGYLYRSATVSASVGGDLYDLFEISDDRVGIVIGDVSGKGVEAATLAGLVKNTIRALAYQNESPADVLARTNAVLFKATAPTTFVTVMFGVLDPGTGHLVYCSAGHTRGIVKRRGGDVELLGGVSPLVGALPDLHYVDEETSIDFGDTLVLYTDGVTEARRGRDMLGEAGLVALVRDLDGVGVPKLPEAIFAAVDEYAGGRLADDVAIVTVGRR